MLDRLTLTNFQAWDRLELPLSAVTVIVGETNAGKSAILRGLSCVLFNAMEGAAMVRTGTKVAAVDLELDGHAVRWERGAGVNRFTVDGQVYDKPGRQVPPAVHSVTQIHELEFDGEVVRLQWAPQFDAPFLLADAGAKATRMLGVAGKAAIVAQAARLAQGETRDRAAGVTVAQAQVDRLGAECERFAYLDAAESLADRVQVLTDRHTQLVQRRMAIWRLIEQLSDVEQRQWVARGRGCAAERLRMAWAAAEQTSARRVVLSSYNAAGLALQLRRTLRSAGQRKADAYATLVRWHEIRSVLIAWQSHADRVGRAQRSLWFAGRLKHGWGCLVQALEIRATLVAYHRAAAAHEQVMTRLNRATQDVAARRQAYETFLATFTCPVCGQLKPQAA